MNRLTSLCGIDDALQFEMDPAPVVVTFLRFWVIQKQILFFHLLLIC